MSSMVTSIWHTLWDVAHFWRKKTVAYVFGRSPLETWAETLRSASTYDEWRGAAQHLDSILDLDMWRLNPTSKLYDYRLINERVRLIQTMRQEGDVYGLLNVLRSGLVRNLGNITSPRLFNCSFTGTKRLIEEYVDLYVEAIRDILMLPPPPLDAGSRAEPTVDMVAQTEWEDGEVTADSGGVEDGCAAAAVSASTAAALSDRSPKGGMATATIPTQHKLDFISHTRQGFGRSALVLQGGAIFGLCHLGVVKALFLQGLLPRVIIGTATGAMMAALVGVHPEEDLLRILTGDGIDLSAFAGKGKDPDHHNEQVRQSMWTRCATLSRRIRRFRNEGYFLDVKVLEECIRANVGDLTFEEAYQRSKRILNITVVPAGQQGIPTLLNHVTAPNVLVWTAAVASNASSSTFYGHRQTKILCKDVDGNILPWAPAATVDFGHWTSASYKGRNAPLQRVSSLFNVNHYIVSQARPYLIPFLQSDMHGPSALGRRNKLTESKAFITRLIGLEMRHRLRQLDRLHLLPASIRRFLVDENIPGGASMTLVPQISLRDFVRLLETPTKETLEYWILRGERSVWPAVAALRVRCAIEMELEKAYQDVKRLKASDLRRKASEIAQMRARLNREAGGFGRGAGISGDVRPRSWSTSARYPGMPEAGD
ncbi:hypothetical protein N657DRAFT_587592 [Parathielavia appendiculata]|uniref:PNPLA domain-containing protein n=1 Tax=Parathielavia appendiculata TaxID=2587402 RepID=A0AAN6UB91_9PEZI|nr:hypothetical protein N657DRAFT_587592 [Parathielavia appendiculata]